MQTKKLILLLIIGLLAVGVVLSGSARPVVAASAVQQADAPSVWAAIQADEQLSDFAAWVKAAGLADNLANDGPFTVFAPTNAAMADFMAEAAASEATRTEILLYHIVNGRYPGPNIVDFNTRPTLLGEHIVIGVDGGQIVLNDTANVITTDVAAANGVIHIVDTVLTPPVNSLITTDKGSRAQTLDEVLAADGRFTTFLSYLEQIGMKDDLANPNQSYTIFAPTDDAFAALTQGQIDAWLSDANDIETTLTYHIVNDQLGINQIATDEYIPTAEGRPLFVTVDDNTMVHINNQPLAEFNIIAANGVIHVVDTVLMP